ncbi:BTB/POZ domain-containing protein At2g04740 isoform X2 [Ziziphus jujuba]|uniref:BTB/POZ domain-containing protein At2g04740 isoform X2 n=1 Tax=Ziziphus jujuba TaxID=326968 RepID=A0ABM3IFE2_ZIZJJ|nr:BTB/POZ domain-containing protein At2g04740 isoform X2 [Ziziphus jujuba]
MPPRRSSWTIDPDIDGIDLDASDFAASVPLKKVPNGDVFEASRAGDVDRLRYLLESGVNVNARDQWDSVALYYACLAGHLDAARMLLESGAICSEHTFDGDRCHYAALNLKVRKLLKAFEARPPPLGPLQAALRETFLRCGANRAYLEQAENNGQLQISGFSSSCASNSNHFPPDVVFFVQDRLEISVDDMEDLVRICKVCKCESLQRIIEKELIHQKYAEYKALGDVDNAQKRFILQGVSLPDEDRLPGALNQILQISLANSTREPIIENGISELVSCIGTMHIGNFVDDLADVCVRIDKRIFRCHQVVLASRSEYFKARLSRVKDFHEGKDGLPIDTLPCLEEHDLSMEAFEKMIEYMYTDGLKDIDPHQAEEMFDAASRYLLFPLKRAVADALLPHLEMVSPAELCHWLILSDMYGVLKIREYCLDTIACNYETFADSREFRAMLLTLPPPSGDSSLRTTVPSAPGAEVNTDQVNLLDDLREKWLEAEAAELDKRDESALLFDKRLEMLMLVAEQEKSDGGLSDDIQERPITSEFPPAATFVPSEEHK